jgi:hypothetical protein
VSDAGLVQRGERFGQPFAAPVEHVIVGQRAAVDACRRETLDVQRIHAVMDSFVRPVVVAGHDARFKIDDPHVGPVEFFQSITPDILIADRAWDGAVRRLRESHIVPGVAHVRLEQVRFAGVGQDLIDASAQHDVAADEQTVARASCP